MTNLFSVSLFSLWIMLSASAHAAAPDLKTPAPVIYLADNLDEADNLGWCIDTVGRGLSDRLHAHSCKPQGGDVQFRFDSGTGQIASVGFPGLCASYDGTLPMGLLACENVDQQRFSYDQGTMTFSPVLDPSLCLAVGAESRTAGPFMSRSLDVVACDSVETDLKTWVIVP